ncbi:unnamed protein product [Orchesella dallaii]|uniref:DUF243 domain-containing protein n=1 Tax=Orchesella dallaii TaxID=48710 RepID=A0ABP1RAU6_9HEXA
MLLKIVLVILSVTSCTYAGGKTLSVQESRAALDLFKRYCNGGSSSQNQDGNTFYYCKFSDSGPITLQVPHEAEVDSGETPKQVVFVQPPSFQYVHNLALRGSPGSPQQTDIYVLPPTAEHSLNLQDTRSSVQAAKPSLYFITPEQSESSSSGTGVVPSRRPGNDVTSAIRPSAPPPPGQNPGAVGVNTGGYQYYGAPPPAINPRNQRNAYSSSYATL